ncbi:hypothetical protein LSM04_008308 [Trypanosoma melophagium]|uniref:uncharacterized protein n=1 Tax=Trypanosoma melophagium TaxID=715481 RepID=UPI00351A9928|nr:hypothetical protein LSM04_001164 [Trypanosoma melophagium]KAH9592978.1 hypothetical protein LSM04_001246 [Trypanosoma melophagium]KAH9593065.1 hypothetical protein LSM04_008308 [Trypanosoma melophagium]
MDKCCSRSKQFERCRDNRTLKITFRLSAILLRARGVCSTTSLGSVANVWYHASSPCPVVREPRDMCCGLLLLHDDIF